MRLVRPDGVGLWYDVEPVSANGPPRPTAMLVPGRGDASDLFPAMFSDALVSAGFRVVRFDPRDTGLSDDGGDDYSMATMVDDALAVLDEVAGIGPAHWIGISMAGMQLLDLVVRQPQRVATLTFLSAISPDPEAGFGELMFGELPPDPVDALIGSMGALSEGDRRWAADHIARGLARAPERPDASARHMAAVSRTDWRTLDDLAAIHAPTLVVHGTVDRTLPLAHAQALADGIEGAELVIRRDMGHLPRPRDWDVIAREVDALAAYAVSSQ